MSSRTIGEELKSDDIRLEPDVELLERAATTVDRKPELPVLYALVLTAFLARTKYQ
jgi:hypothetical protein